MHPDFWLERWEANRIGFHNEEINAHLPAFWDRLEIERGASVFVPLSGKSLDMLWLARQGHNVLGVEVSPLAVADFFRESGIEPKRVIDGAFERWSGDVPQGAKIELLCGDFFALQPEQLIGTGGVYDRASLIALPPEMRPNYAQQLKRLLPASTPILLVTLDYPQSEMDGPPFAVTADEVESLYGERHQIQRLYDQDVLAENPHFRQRGLTRLSEEVFSLTSKTARQGPHDLP